MAATEFGKLPLANSWRGLIDRWLKPTPFGHPRKWTHSESEKRANIAHFSEGFLATPAEA